MRHFCRILAPLLIILGLSLPASAGLKEANEAYAAGRYEEAFKELQPLAEQGDAEAQYKLGVLYNNGQGVTQDYTLANEWYRKAAEQGQAKAQLRLALLYAQGNGVKQDPVLAAEWCQKAAEQGLAEAQFTFGAFYEEGLGVSQNYTLAAEWYQKAAEQGLAEAQLKLALNIVCKWRRRGAELYSSR